MALNSLRSAQWRTKHPVDALMSIVFPDGPRASSIGSQLGTHGPEFPGFRADSRTLMIESSGQAHLEVQVCSCPSPPPQAIPFSVSTRETGQMPRHVDRDMGHVWKSLWGNTITGRNPAHLPQCGIPRPHLALGSIPPKTPRGGRRVRAHFRQHLPRSSGSLATSRLARSAIWPDVETRSWETEADAVINALRGCLRPFTAATEG